MDFTSEENRHEFATNSKSYAPKYGGYCANAATEAGGKVLADALSVLRHGLNTYLDIEKQNKGERSPEKLRDYIVSSLASRYSEMFDQAPTSTPEGQFVELCHHTLGAMRLSTDGLETAVQRILMRMKSGRS